MNWFLMALGYLSKSGLFLLLVCASFANRGPVKPCACDACTADRRRKAAQTLANDWDRATDFTEAEMAILRARAKRRKKIDEDIKAMTRQIERNA